MIPFDWTLSRDDRETGGDVILRTADEMGNKRRLYGSRTPDCEYRGYHMSTHTEIDGTRFCTCDGCVAFREWWTDNQ